MKVGVLGATGMLGHHAARAIVAAGHELVVLHRTGSRLDPLGDLNYESRFADVNQADILTSALTGLDGVIHSAAYYPTLPRPWPEDVELARRQMASFLEAVAESRIPRAVYVGGSIAIPRRKDGRAADESGVYEQEPPGRNPYVHAKVLMDRMAREAGADGLPVSIAIPSMTFGEYDVGPSTGQIITGIASGLMQRYVRGERNVIYAGDAGRGLLAVLEKGQAGRRYLLTGENTDMDGLVARIAELAGVATPRPVPLAMARLISRVQGLRFRLIGGKPPLISDTAIAVMSAGQHLDGSRAEKELDFRARFDVDHALSVAFQWFRDAGYLDHNAGREG